MYRKLPNLILGFHGCTKDVFDKVILHGEEMTPSTNDYDWLGHGVYFWEQNYERAKQWAEEMCKRRHLDSPPMVIGAVIDLGLCLNLSDSDSINLLFDSKNGLLEDLKNADVPAPVNSKYEHCLDCAVIQYLHDSRKEMGDSQFDSVRGFFYEGSELSDNSSFFYKSHVQICVRNPNCIKGYFRPRQICGEWTLP